MIIKKTSATEKQYVNQAKGRKKQQLIREMQRYWNSLEKKG